MVKYFNNLDLLFIYRFRMKCLSFWVVVWLCEKVQRFVTTELCGSQMRQVFNFVCCPLFYSTIPMLCLHVIG